MKSEMKVEAPEKINLTLTITLPLADWQELSSSFREEKRTAFPISEVRQAVRQMTQQATAQFEPQATEDITDRDRCDECDTVLLCGFIIDNDEGDDTIFKCSCGFINRRSATTVYIGGSA